MGLGASYGARRGVPWRSLFRRLSLALGWLPRQVAELTLEQTAVYACRLADRHAVVRMSGDQRRALVAGRRAAREAWVEEQLARRRLSTRAAATEGKQ